MDLHSKHMYDTYKDEIWKELGPLDPDWFEALTAQSFTNEENVSDQDELCANQEGNFKTPFDRAAVDSQLFSTPKVFRHNRPVSPETEDEQSFNGEQEKETLPWTAAQSPCLFRTSKEGIPGVKYGGFQPEDSFDLLHTPQKSPVSYSKHISESLGAQIHHDMSWTSSLNTPPAVPSTLILSKSDESPCPVSVSTDKTVVFVRKLFPSLSNASRVEVVSPKSNEIPSVPQGAVSPEPGQSPELHESPQSSLNQSDGVWKQKLPDAIEEEDVRRTVASVLEGAENALSIFFTNSNSALRKVKTDRIKRKQIISTKDQGCSSADISTTNNSAFNEQKTADQEPGRHLSSPPLKTGDVGITQWSPLSLSEIPPYTVDSSCRDNSPVTQVKNSILIERLQSDSDSGHPQKPTTKPTNSGFTMKKRTFVYTLDTSKSQGQGKETPSHTMMDSSPGILDTGQEVNVKQLGNLPPSVQAKFQDLDMSQLCKDFAQDFSQMSGSCKPSKKAEDTPRNGFSPSACLSAMKKAKEKAMQVNFHHDCEDASIRRHVSTTHHNTSTYDGTISDSGFQSAVADNTHMTTPSFILPSLEIKGQSELRTGLKTDIHRTTPFTSTSKGNGHSDLDSILQETDTEAKLSSVIKESQTPGPGKGSVLQIESTSIQLPSSANGTVDNINCIPLNGEVCGSLPEKTTASLPSAHASGFKTASNKGIHISSANLEIAKRLFEETEGEITLSDKPTKVKNQTTNQWLSSSEKNEYTSCHLTASQKADVTELCTLLEDAESQFEFTQFKTAKPKQSQGNATSPQKADKELDPDFLSGIDFDDSFSSEAEKLTVMQDSMSLASYSKTKCETFNVTSKSTDLSLSSAMKKEHPSSVHVSSSSKHISEGSSSIMSAEPKSLDKAGHTERSKLESKNPLMLGVGFKTAGGNVLRVSKKCLSKARALFADLEENLVTSQESENKQSNKTDAKTLLKSSVVNPSGYLLHHKEDNSKFSGCGTDAEEGIQGCFSNTKDASSDQQTTGIRDATKSLKNIKTDKTTHHSGFQMASGKDISISAKAMQDADAFFRDCDAMASNTGVSVKHAKSIEPLPGSVSPKESPRKCNKNLDEFENVNAGPAASHTEVIQHNVEIDTFGFNNTLALTSAASFHGNTPSIAKGLSSLSCKPSKNIDSPAINGLSNGGGFCTASGKKVSMSADALKKAELLFNDFHTVEDTNKQLKQKEDALGTGKLTNQIQVSAPKNGGFQTASGKGVAISSAALKKAKFLLSECEGDEDTNGVKPNHSKMPVPTPPPRKSGFLAASGKSVALSAEALQKAKALFSDITFSAKSPDTRHSDKKQDSAENTEKMHCGFMTAGGAKVHLAQKNLLKAKTLLEEFDDGSISTKAMQEADAFFENCENIIDVNEDMLVQHKKSVAPVSGSGIEKKTLSEVKQDQRMTNMSEEPGNGHTHFENVNDEKLNKGVFKNTLDSTNAASLHRNPSLIKQFPPLLCTTSQNISSSANNELSKGGGFCTASGKKVSVSDDAMAKAKSLLNESATIEDTNKRLKQKEEIFPPQNGGFQTASGKGVTISSAALKKAKTLLSECEGAEDENGVKPTDFKIPVPGPLPSTTGFLAASGKPVALSAEAFQKAKALFSDISFTAEISDAKINDNKQDNAENTENMHCGFTTAGGAKVHVSQKSLLKAKTLLEETDDGSISVKAMQEADAFFENCNIMDANNDMSGKHKKSLAPVTPLIKQKEETPSPQNGGFQTASGKGVTISSAALKKAKTLLSECEGEENGVKPTHSKMAVPGPPPRKCGILSASRNPVAFSSEALQKAKALFSDISLSAESSDKRNSDKQQDNAENTEKMQCGFTTAGGEKVHVSKTSLLKANNLLTEFDGECYDSTLHSSPHDTNKSDPSEVKCNLTTAIDSNVPQRVKSLTSFQGTGHGNEILQNPSVPGCSYKDKRHPSAFKSKQGKVTPAGVGNLHGSPEEEMSSILDYEINQTSSSEVSKVKRHQESSVLKIQSLNLSGCTETQQRFLAQEALDCTKALLEDESLAGQSLSMTFENVQENAKSSHSSVEEQTRTEKRPVEDPDMTSQPPLKRRLLEEFDRTVDSPTGSTLRPEKSCPNGVMKDRRVFKYSTSLHPSITRPHRNGKNYVETILQRTTPTKLSTPGESRSAHSKTPTFVPPFHKNTKTERHNNTALKDNIRTPSAFVPPFKKQRTFVEESSSKPQEDKHHHLSAMPFNSNTYVPPTKKTQSTTDLTGNKSKEDIQSVALADSTNDDLMNNQKCPVGCGSEDSALEAACVEDTLSRNQDMFQNLHNVELARDMQDMRIRKKKRQTIRPLPGSLFLTKTSGVSRTPFKAAVNGKPPGRYTQKQLYGHGVHQHVYEITSEIAESFRFEIPLFIKREAVIDGGGVQLADGGWLIPSKDGTAGKEEFYRALCDTPGVDPKLISEGWVYNHYRWIVWKQASMERSFPETMGGLCLTPEQVLLQLKYRYDVEVDHSRRPALRKIMEKDDTAAKTLVLCVSGVVSRGHSPNRQRSSDTKTPQGANAKVENPSAVVWLTDGWYAIKAQLDEPLTAMLHKGRVAVGGKLIIHGAQLVGSQDACSPLEAPESLMLKICANSSRPTRWDAKLGFYRDPRPFLLPVSCLYSSGGPVGCVDIIILRSYPIQWMERKPDGGVVFRSVRAEEKEARRYNNQKQKAMEILFAKIQAEFEKEDKGNNKPQRRRRTIGSQDIASLQDGEELYEAVGDDPAYLEAHLSDEQLETLRTYRSSLMEKKQAELQERYRQALQNAEDSEGSCPKRDVTHVWRLCLADSMGQPSSVFQLNLWRPSSDLQSLLKEGCRYKVYHLTTSDGKKHGGSTTVQLTGTKKTQFQDLQASQEWLSTRFQPRVSTHFVDLQNTEFQPLCGEVDLTGYVISIVDGQGFSPAFYLTDGKRNFVKVRCFNSFAQSGLDDVVKPRALLALSNLQLRGQSTTPTPVVYAGDLTVFSTNPKEVHLQESLCQLRNLVQGQENFFPVAEEELSRLISSDGLGSISSPAFQTRTAASATIVKQDTKTSVTSQQSVRSLGSFTPVSRKPPAANCSTEKDPVSLKRKRALDYLSRIPSPPPLSVLGSVASPYVNKTFNAPRRSETPSTLKTVQTPACKPVKSPVEDEWVNDEELAMIDTQALRW
ncbi:breast cancer type 2 susceptibility protein [Centropristis striata]|uniref:breast cancer type 2 susceptibility protein n=1 Tax=Centropristis striata TaxID=184440 RepID=UPI0027DEFB28|nr:breast cancer type 2 susceptibility protein [Centropristis striata]